MAETPTRVVVEIVGQDKTDAAIKSASEKLEQLKRQTEAPGGKQGGFFGRLKTELTKERAMFTGLVFWRMGLRFGQEISKAWQSSVQASLDANFATLEKRARALLADANKMARALMRSFKLDAELEAARNKYREQTEAQRLENDQIARRILLLQQEKDVRESVLRHVEAYEQFARRNAEHDLSRREEIVRLRNEMDAISALMENLQPRVGEQYYSQQIDDTIRRLKELSDKGVLRKISDAVASWAFAANTAMNEEDETRTLQLYQRLQEESEKLFEGLREEISERQHRLQVIEAEHESLKKLRKEQEWNLELEMSMAAAEEASAKRKEMVKAAERVAEAFRRAVERARELAGELARPVFAGTWEALRGLAFPQLYGVRVANLMQAPTTPMASMTELFHKVLDEMRQQRYELMSFLRQNIEVK